MPDLIARARPAEDMAFSSSVVEGAPRPTTNPQSAKHGSGEAKQAHTHAGAIAKPVAALVNESIRSGSLAGSPVFRPAGTPGGASLAMRVGTVLAWTGVTVSMLLFIGLAVQAFLAAKTNRQSLSPVKRGAPRAAAPKIPTATQRIDSRADVYKAGPDTSAFQSSSPGTIYTDTEKPATLVDDDVEDVLMDSYDRVGAALKAFRNARPREVIAAAGQVAGRNCRMEWETNGPSLMFGKNLALSQSLVDCEAAIKHIQIQKREMRVAGKSSSSAVEAAK